MDPALLRVRAPKVPQKKIETYADAQLAAIFQATLVGWLRLAIQILLGTAMRISELAALTVEDVEDMGRRRSSTPREGRKVPAYLSPADCAAS